MRTPAGKECRYFYGNYYRGGSQEECRLLSASNPPLTWRAAMCTSCPVPAILLANACESMVLEPRLVRPLMIKKHQIAPEVADIVGMNNGMVDGKEGGRK